MEVYYYIIMSKTPDDAERLWCDLDGYKILLIKIEIYVLCRMLEKGIQEILRVARIITYPCTGGSA